ncbi:MAG: hypothetical protein QXT74_04870 [Candidatus Nezhaarchaeales archaeon]
MGASARRRLVLLWFAALLVLNYVVPYALLSGYQRLAGAYLFWTLVTLAAALSCFVLMRRWRGKG